LVQPGWLLQKPFTPVHLVVAERIHGEPSPGCLSGQALFCDGPVGFPAPWSVKLFSTVVQGAASTHCPLSHPGAAPA